jgi:hypothetical protein
VLIFVQGKLAEHDAEAEAVGSLNSYISPEELKNLSEAERRALEIERSKYLGGSENTTHLVKGLDYALLAKVKEDLAKKERETELQQRADDPTLDRSAGSGFSKVISTDGPILGVESIDEFKTFIGKSVYEVLFRKPSYVLFDLILERVLIVLKGDRRSFLTWSNKFCF